MITEQSEKFLYGMAAGFYDALTDESVRYIDDILRYGIRTSDDASFLTGYRAGKQRRIGCWAYGWRVPGADTAVSPTDRDGNTHDTFPEAAQQWPTRDAA